MIGWFRSVIEQLRQANARTSTKPPIMGRGSGVRQHPIVRYVNTLLTEIVHTSRTVVLSEEAELPNCDEVRLADKPTYEQVTNRLKVMAGIPPMHLNEPAEAEFTHTTHLGSYKVQVRFSDEHPGRCCLAAAHE